MYISIPQNDFPRTTCRTQSHAVNPLKLNQVIMYDRCSLRSVTRVWPPTGPCGTVAAAVASRKYGEVRRISAIRGTSRYMKMAPRWFGVNWGRFSGSRTTPSRAMVPRG